MRALRTIRHRLAILATIALLASPLPAQAASFNWEGSRAQEVTSSVLDLVLVRPLATARVIVGGLLFVPAVVISAPGGREGFDSAYDTLIAEPTEFAFQRKIGEL